jgi:hypothetical protein
MDRRKMLQTGFRCLARVLPAMVANAGSQEFSFHKSGAPVLDRQPGCFPAPTAEKVKQTSTPYHRRDKDGNKPP